jgi:hypothetical protein
MAIHSDEKGKIFTEVINKERVEVTIQTRENRIRGHLHKREDKRVLDKLNSAEQFLPITQVIVFDLKGERELFRSEFLALNRNEIIWMVEDRGVSTRE